MEVDTAHASSSNDAEIDHNPNPLASETVSAMEAEDDLPWVQHIREASQSPSSSVPVLTRFVGVLDSLDTRVERLRKEAMLLQEKRDQLLISLDLIKNNDLFANLEEYERDEINYYLDRVSSRLGTVELSVRTVRNQQQEDCLHQLNILIDNLINSQDLIQSRCTCQLYLNACSHDPTAETAAPIDKKFENALLGSTLDDQKEIKKRLQALMTYFNKRTVCE